MSTWAVLATGPSMSREVAEFVRGKCRVVAVSDAYRLAPWADALASTDEAWWRAHPDAISFAGSRFTGAPAHRAIRGVERLPGSLSGTNSGLLGCQVAYAMGATRILLCGFDMRGDHFFGRHPAPLQNTTPARFAALRKQFAFWAPHGVEVINCTPSSALKIYPQMPLELALCR
jgi:hypothetical protein